MPDLDWKKLIGSVAPALATALGGPLAGVATQAISTALLGKPDGKNAEIAAALSSGGADALLKLKQAENDFAVKMREMDIDLEKIAASDRNSAREREKVVKDKTPAIMAAFTLIGFFGILAAMMFIQIPDKSQSPLEIMLGSLATAFISIISYYFGSSAGSAKKTETIDKMLSQ